MLLFNMIHKTKTLRFISGKAKFFIKWNFIRHRCKFNILTSKIENAAQKN